MIRLALIHAGSQAVARVAPRWRAARITAVVEPTADEAQRVAKQVGAAVWGVSAQQLHEQHDDTFDTWLAATPLGWIIVPHAHQPLRLDPAQWHDHPGRWQWGHPSRFLPSVVAVRESVESKKLGEPGLVRIHAWQSKPAHDVQNLLLPQLELACGLVNQPPTVVRAQSRSQNGARDAERAAAPFDYVQVHLGFADDRMALIDCSVGLPAGVDYYSLSVIGSTGAAYADDHHNMQLLLAGDHARAMRTSQGDRTLLATVQEYVDATAQARAPRCGVSEWKLASRVAAAVRRSLQTGQAVALTEGGDP